LRSLVEVPASRCPMMMPNAGVGESAYTPACLLSRCRSRACRPAHSVTVLDAAVALPLSRAGHAAAAIPGALRCAQRDLTGGAFGNLPSCFARRAASVSNDRAIFSNFFLTRGSVAWLARASSDLSESDLGFPDWGKS